MLRSTDKVAAPWTDEMQRDSTEAYLNNYLTSFMIKEVQQVRCGCSRCCCVPREVQQVRMPAGRHSRGGPRGQAAGVDGSRTPCPASA